MKYEYVIYVFETSKVQETQDFINTKARNGFKIINIHYFDELNEKHVRYTLEKTID